MSTSLKLFTCVLVSLGSVLVLVAIRAGVVDVAVGLVLIGALAMLTRTALRTASEIPGRRQPRE